MDIIQAASPFDRSFIAIGQAWRDNAVLADPGAYRITGKIGEGASSPQWATGADGTTVVVKAQNGNIGIAAEKIAADLAAYLGLPVPPARIWVKPALLDGSDEVYAVSLKAFPHSRPNPSSLSVARDPFIAAIAVFDRWIGNNDRHTGNIVYDAASPADAPAAGFAYIDHGCALLPGDLARPALYAAGLQAPKTWRWPFIPYEQALADIRSPGSLAHAVLQRLCDMPDTAIAEIVARLPDAIYSPDQKKYTVDLLRLGRDIIADEFFPATAETLRLTPEQQDQANRALFEHAAEGDLAAVRHDLKRHAADPRAGGDRAFLLAAENDRLEVFRYLVAEVNPDLHASAGELFRGALRSGGSQVFDCLLSAAFDALPVQHASVAAVDALADTVLGYCAEAALTPDTEDQARRLVSRHAGERRYDVQCYLNRTLSEAISENDFPAIDVAIAAGADVYHDNSRPLCNALWHLSADRFRDLLARHRIEIRDPAAATAILAVALSQGQPPDKAACALDHIFRPDLWTGRDPAEFAALIGDLYACQPRLGVNRAAKNAAYDLLDLHAARIGRLLLPEAQAVPDYLFRHAVQAGKLPHVRAIAERLHPDLEAGDGMAFRSALAADRMAVFAYLVRRTYQPGDAPQPKSPSDLAAAAARLQRFVTQDPLIPPDRQADALRIIAATAARYAERPAEQLTAPAPKRPSSFFRGLFRALHPT